MSSYIGAHLGDQGIRQDRSLKSATKNLVQRMFPEKEAALTGEQKDELLHALKTPVFRRYKKNNLSPDGLSRLQDITGGQFSLTPIDLLKRFENNDKKGGRGGIFPSSGTIKRIRKAVERYGRKRIPCRRGYLSTGEGEFYEFDVDSLLVYAIKAFGLEEIAKQRHVRISISIDGAQLSKRLTHVTIGFKISDVAGRCPFTGRLLFGSTDGALLQSRNICIPVKIAMCKETKKTYEQEFEGVFKRFHQLSTENTDGLPEGSVFTNMGFKPILLSLNCDMSASWKVFRVGGAAKVHTFSCHCCTVTKETICTPNPTECAVCQEMHSDKGPDWKCFHHDLLKPETLQKMNQDFDHLQ